MNRTWIVPSSKTAHNLLGDFLCEVSVQFFIQVSVKWVEKADSFYLFIFLRLRGAFASDLAFLLSFLLLSKLQKPFD